jgi:hypothetical protein
MTALAVRNVLAGWRVPVSRTVSPLAESEEVLMDERGALAHAIADLAEQAGSDPGGVMVVALEKVIWRDESMGCPEPGKEYPRVRVHGYRIVLRINGEEVTYHGAQGRLPFRCDHPDSNATHLGPDG